MKYQKIHAHFQFSDPVVYEVIKDLDFDAWLRPYKKASGQSYFEALIRSITGQQLSTKAARTIHGRVLDLFENKTPTPESVRDLDAQALRDAGMSWGKVKYVKDLADKILDETLKLDKLEDMDEQLVIKELIKVKGIGQWTAEMFLMFTLGREDIFSHGDLGLRRGIEKLYGLREPSKDQIEEITQPWSPYRSYGSIALWRSLE